MYHPPRVSNTVVVATRAVSVILLAAAPIEASAAGGSTTGDWTTFGNGPTHSGFYPATVGHLPITEGWIKEFPTGINPVAVAGGRVFLTTNWNVSDGMFAAALNAETGDELWRYPLDRAVAISGPTVSNDRVFFYRSDGDDDSVLYALDGANGQLQWASHFETQGGSAFGPTVSTNGIWIRAGYFGGMEGFNLNGSSRFLISLNQASDWTPTYDGNALYTCIDGVFVASDPQTGVKLWHLDLRRPGEELHFAAQPVVANNKASMISFGFVAPEIGNSLTVATIDLPTRSLAWRGPHGIDPETGFTIGYRGIPATDGEKVYAIYGSSSVRALDAQTGQVVGTYEADHLMYYPLTGQPLVTNDLVIVSRSPGMTYIFDKVTYALRTTLLRGGELSFAGDVLYIASPFFAPTSDLGTSTLATYRFRTGIPQPVAPLKNISTRVRVGAGDKAAIGGFIVTGTEPKRIMIRGIGPSLTSAGITGVLADPTLVLHKSTTGEAIARNHDWQTTEIGGAITTNQVAEIQSSTIAPKNSREAAMIVTVQPGDYTAVMSGANDGTGTGLVEIYDLDPASGSKLANLSTRGFVEIGELMIAGSIIGYQDTRIIARAISPRPEFLGFVLDDPTLELYDSNGSSVAFNDDWTDTQRAEIEATTIPPTNDLDSAIVQTLVPGQYTLILRGANMIRGGFALVEVYSLNE